MSTPTGERMVFQILTRDRTILTVHTHVGDGITRVVIDELPQRESEDVLSCVLRDVDSGCYGCELGGEIAGVNCLVQRG